jgi:glycosyltransferase involved in cell wall biosynthesis
MTAGSSPPPSLSVAVGHAFYRQAGGENHFVHEEAKLLRTRHEVHLVGGENDALRPNLRTAAAMIYSPHHLEWATEALRSIRPDVLHLHNIYPSLGPALHLAARALHIPVVMTVHNFRLRCPNGYMYTQGHLCSRCTKGNHTHAVVHQCFPDRKQAAAYASATWIHRFLLKLENRVEVFIAPSEFVAKTLIGWGIPVDRVHLVRHFVDGAVATSAPSRTGIFAGRLSPEKRVDTLLTALALAGDPPFLIVGDGPLAQPLRNQVAELGLKNTEFLGHISREQLQELWDDVGYAVVCSGFPETASLIALEAMTAGRSLIVSDVGALTELAERTGSNVVPAGDPASLAQAVRRIVSDDTARREQGLRAREFAMKELQPAAHLRGLERTYDEAIKSSARFS